MAKSLVDRYIREIRHKMGEAVHDSGDNGGGLRKNRVRKLGSYLLDY